MARSEVREIRSAFEVAVGRMTRNDRTSLTLIGKLLQLAETHGKTIHALEKRVKELERAPGRHLIGRQR
jgi:hypothetical protein